MKPIKSHLRSFKPLSALEVGNAAHEDAFSNAAMLRPGIFGGAITTNR